MTIKLTFKKQPKATGLSAVGYSRQSLDIELSKKSQSGWDFEAIKL